MAFNFVSYLTPGAPNCFGANNQGTLLLDYILGTIGGWTTLFTNTTSGSRVYQPVSGNTVLYAASQSTISGSANVVTVRAAESATNFGSANLTNPFPTVAQAADSANCIWWLDSAVQSAINRPWWAIVSDSWVLFAVLVTGNTASVGTTSSQLAVQFYGRPSLVDSADSFGTVLTITTTGSIIALLSSATSAGVGSTANIFWDRNHDGTILSSRGAIPAPGSFGGVASAPTYPHPDTGKMYRQKVALTDAASTTAAIGSKALLVRGWMPNLWFPQHTSYNTANIAPGDTFTDTGYNPSALFLFIASQLATPFCAIETTNTWSAPT